MKLLTDKPITARDLMNREHGNKPQKHKSRVHNQTIKKRKGVKPGFKQRGNMVYLHRLPNNYQRASQIKFSTAVLYQICTKFSGSALPRANVHLGTRYR